MGKVYHQLTTDQIKFIQVQPLFFVATAPLDSTGHVNLSPKGLDSFRVLSKTQVMYLDLNGSGNETSAHLAENGRITFMFCGFQKRPLILRLYGQGVTVLPDDPAWSTLAAHFATSPYVDLSLARQIIRADLHRVQSSCGFGVPQIELKGQRDTLTRWAEEEGPDGLRAYQQEYNCHSIDGLLSPIGEQVEEQARQQGPG